MASKTTTNADLPRWYSYPLFLWRIFYSAFDGSWRFYTWLFVLTAVWLVGGNAWAHQVADGMASTGMSDHVSWGLYIANFTFIVGLAAGAVMMVIPAYLYDEKEMHDVVLIGEILAIAAIIMCMFFVVVDMGRPDRLWHIIPGLGRFNWPLSMLTWDVLVLNGYLLLNLHIVGYLLYCRFRGKPARKRWYLPFVFLSIGWAISIHTITAFLYSGLGGRPFWNSALLAPRFIVSAFVTGPAFVLILLQVIKRFSSYPIASRPLQVLTAVLRVTILLNLFMLGSEVFTAFYTGGAHESSARYLFFGLHGKSGLVPWAWGSLFLNVSAVALLYVHHRNGQLRFLNIACIAAFVGVWIEKGMGLIIPGFIPSTLHEIVEYQPSLTEWKVSAGIWAFGLLVLTVGIKVAIPILTGESILANRNDRPD